MKVAAKLKWKFVRHVNEMWNKTVLTWTPSEGKRKRGNCDMDKGPEKTYWDQGSRVWFKTEKRGGVKHRILFNPVEQRDDSEGHG